LLLLDLLCVSYSFGYRLLSAFVTLVSFPIALSYILKTPKFQEDTYIVKFLPFENDVMQVKKQACLELDHQVLTYKCSEKLVGSEVTDDQLG